MAINIEPAAPIDGIVYADAVPILSVEGTLGDGGTPAIIPITEGQTIVAVVKLVAGGLTTSNSTYVVLQTDLGDGTWIDVAWLFWDGRQGSATFVLCGGGLGQMNNAFEQSRQAQAVPNPQASGSNAVPLGGRVRFVGQAQVTGASSAAPGDQTSHVTATITYRIQKPR